MQDEDTHMTHDQLVARVQAFSSFLRARLEEAKKEKGAYGQDPEEKRINDLVYACLEDIDDTYHHTFESVLYTWLG